MTEYRASDIALPNGKFAHIYDTRKLVKFNICKQNIRTAWGTCVSLVF